MATSSQRPTQASETPAPEPTPPEPAPAPAPVSDPPPADAPTPSQEEADEIKQRHHPAERRDMQPQHGAGYATR